MALGFLPNRDTMCKEVEQWIALRKLDTLLSVCDCCVFKTFNFILSDDCRICQVRKGIAAIVEERKRARMSEQELVSAF